MNKISSIVALVVVIVLTSSFAYRSLNRPNAIIEGVVIADDSGKPISNVHVFVVDGEEEALSKSKGEFRFSTAARFPLTITASHPSYQKSRITVTSAGQRVTIRLKK